MSSGSWRWPLARCALLPVGPRRERARSLDDDELARDARACAPSRLSLRRATPGSRSRAIARELGFTFGVAVVLAVLAIRGLAPVAREGTARSRRRARRHVALAPPRSPRLTQS